ncbi:TIGR03084 family metal-binding protein [Rhodococcoides corynebacterioides]|uniref:TIGR03084 family protein n=1 Tax=Rhodococcoides corynebacterioides TaxID=53972 RepID=A0ABS7PA95_9NOCA|nr:TIGR03084 family metal-binding protein [Rhodococcus corynebacterioides]MBY6368514.1 TIGR03084 family protein [Rhodococcus corynebacterioides]MBY6409389.1 TIGR03084 family protein [Rhodococcus corynebacterioides]
MADTAAVLADLRAEGDALDDLLADVDEAGWRTPTPATGWTVAHQIAHLHWTDHVAALTAAGSAGDRDAAAAFDAVLADGLADPAGFVDAAAETLAGEQPSTLLARWRLGRSQLLSVLPGVPAGTRIRWFGPPMSATSMATARLMETWAHGQDVVDALGVHREPTARLRHVAHLGVRTREFAYALRDRPAPTSPVHVVLTAPDGTEWTWGPEDAEQRVTGPALDFCLLVTQRVHRDDTALVAVGGDAEEWLTIAQAFAGAPGAGRDRLADWTAGTAGRAGTTR